MSKGQFGFRIGPDFERPENTDFFKTLIDFETPLLSDGLNNFNTLESTIKPVVPGVTLAGPALTVKMRPADNLMLHKAIDLAQPGDIIIVDTGGTTDYAILGDLMTSSAFKKNVGGFVIDGAIRDIDQLKEKNYPVFAKAISPNVGDKDGPGEINYPISCGGVVVNPGDYVIGDANGVVVIPPDQLDNILEKSKKKMKYEKMREENIEKGILARPDIDDILRKANVL